MKGVRCNKCKKFLTYEMLNSVEAEELIREGSFVCSDCINKEMAEEENISPEREMAIEIISEFEDLLDRYDIDIPDEDREGNEEEARIYGRNYYYLEDTLTDKLKNWRKK